MVGPAHLTGTAVLTVSPDQPSTRTAFGGSHTSGSCLGSQAMLLKGIGSDDGQPERCLTHRSRSACCTQGAQTPFNQLARTGRSARYAKAWQWPVYLPISPLGAACNATERPAWHLRQKPLASK